MRTIGPAARLLGSAVGLGLGGVLVALLVTSLPHAEREPAPTSAAVPPSAPLEVAPSESELGAFPLPSGAALGIACEDAQRVTAFLRRELSTPAIAPLPGELAEVWAELMDPHGLWSAAPDSPLAIELSAAAPEMLAGLHDQSAGCDVAARIASSFEVWLTSLAAIYQSAFDAAREQPPLTPREVFRLGAEPIFQDDPVTRPATELARELGLRLGAFVARFPEEHALAEQARERFFPSNGQLSGIVTLAALRAYVPLVDPHGDFAPLDEQWLLYAGDATLDAGSPLWADVIRTPLGARVVDAPAAPLQVDDQVLSINGLWLAGASIDQIEQAARSAPEQGEMKLRVLRQGETELLSLGVAGIEELAEVGLEVEHIPYGEGQRVLRVVIPDVGDWLGDELSEVLAREAGSSSALLLDLRGNGGGSLDAAVAALGLLLPGKRLFPLVRRGVVVEVLQAPRPAAPYLGPVAALVDGDTASAAEMIAGGLQAYGRGQVIGARTFGKGCVQEYFDDVIGTGVVRLTTLQFVMPSGKPLQQIGLTPDLVLPLAPALERESSITRQPITFDGPDVRDAVVAGPPWPRLRGVPGPCRDPLVCTAISRLGGKMGARPRAATR